MDIDLLSKMVKELILDNDRVVLPGLGSFVAEIVPAAFADKGYTINPPYRRLYFRSKPDQGEELAKFYSDSNNVDLAVADRIVKDFVAELKSVLHVKKTVIFPGLGRLRATKENTVFFVADEDLDIYPDGFGLEPISLKTHQESREEVTAAVVGLKSILDDSPAVLLPEDAHPSEMVEDNLPNDIVELEVFPEVSPEDGVAADLEPVPVSESESDPSLEPTPVPDPMSVPDPTSVPEPVHDLAPEPMPEPIPEPVPVPESVQLSTAEAPEVPEAPETPEVNETQEIRNLQQAQEHQESAPVINDVKPAVAGAQTQKPSGRGFWKTFGKVLLWTCVSVAALLAVYVAVSRLCPGLMDSVLYTPEELEIVNDLKQVVDM